MAEPLDLNSIGVPQKRNSVLVAETTALVRPFTEGKSDLAIGPRGTLEPNGTRSDDGMEESALRSRIGRRFRSF